MSRSLATLALVLVCSLIAAAEQPAPAILVHADGREEQVWIVEDSFDKLKYKPDERAQAEINLTWDRVADVRYDETKHVDFLRARRASGAEAAEHYAKVVANGRYAWMKIASLLGMADALAQAKKPADAVAALDKLIAEHPKSRYVPDAMEKKGRILLASGDQAAAQQAFENLRAKAKGFGHFAQSAEAAAVAGLAGILEAKKDHAGAAQLLAQALGAIDKGKHPQSAVQVGVALSRAQAAAGAKDKALAALDGLYYLPAAGDLQAAVHLQAARILSEGSAVEQQQRAFDHAVIAGLRVASGGRLQAEAKALARRLAQQLHENAKLSDAQRLEYKQYVGSL